MIDVLGEIARALGRKGDAASGAATAGGLAQLRELLDNRLTATVAGRIDATISSRAPASTAVSTADATNGRAANLDNLDAAISSRLSAVVNSVQRGTIELTSSDAIVNATISSVDTSKAIVLWGGNGTPLGTGGTGNSWRVMTTLKLTGATNVRAERYGSGTQSAKVSYHVVEFK